MAPVSRWDRQRTRYVESIQSKLLDQLGTTEETIIEVGGVALHYRKPLTLSEVNRMAQTPEVRRREGRP